MQNLRIVPVKKHVDTFGTGDHQQYNVYEVRRDFTYLELNGTKDKPRNWQYSPSVITNGVLVETFNSKTNAAIFVDALNEINKNK